MPFVAKGRSPVAKKGAAMGGSRTQDLIPSGVMPESKKPIWYDIYAAFPPPREPLFQELCVKFCKVQGVVPTILHKEVAVGHDDIKNNRQDFCCMTETYFKFLHSIDREDVLLNLCWNTQGEKP